MQGYLMTSNYFVNDEQMIISLKGVCFADHYSSVSGSVFINFIKHKINFKYKMMTKVTKEVNTLIPPLILYQSWASKFHN